MSRDGEKIVVVIPALNEESGIVSTLREVKQALAVYPSETLVVDGRSTDNTVKIAKDQGALVVYQIGVGYGDALLTGFMFGLQHLGATILLTLDADGTYDVQGAPKLIEPILSGDADYVVGRRVIDRKAMGLMNRLGNWAISWMTRRLLRIPLRDSQTGMFAFRSYLVEETDFRTKGWAVNTEMLKQAVEMEMTIKEVSVPYRARVGDSKLRLISGGVANLVVILRMMRDAEPIILFGLVAVGCILLGLVAGASVVIEWILTGTETHVGTAVLSALSVIVGIQLLAFGLLADMIKQLRRKTRPRREIRFRTA